MADDLEQLVEQLHQEADQLKERAESEDAETEQAQQVHQDSINKVEEALEKIRHISSQDR